MHVSAPGARKRCRGREVHLPGPENAVGVAWFRARGEPNIVQEPGDYEALYAGFGFETHLTESITMGPELSLMLALREKSSSFDFVPQFNWHITWGF